MGREELLPKTTKLVRLHERRLYRTENLKVILSQNEIGSHSNIFYHFIRAHFLVFNNAYEDFSVQLTSPKAAKPIIVNKTFLLVIRC